MKKDYRKKIKEDFISAWSKHIEEFKNLAWELNPKDYEGLLDVLHELRVYVVKAAETQEGSKRSLENGN